MNKYFKISGLLPILAIAFLSFIVTPSAQAAVKSHIAPVGMPMSGDYTITVDGQNVPVYRGQGFDDRSFPSWLPRGDMLPYSFAYFDFSGSAQVKVTSNAKALTSSLIVRPESKGVRPTVAGNYMTFTLNTPTNLSIEPAGKNGPLLLFANPMEVSPPTASTSTIKYFGPGLHKPGQISLTSGQTLYLAAGAVVQATVYGNGSNISIRGRGIIDNFPTPWKDGGGISVRCDNCTNYNVEGVIVKDGPAWSFMVLRGKGVNVRNLKIVASSKGNQDGIDLVNSQDVMITDSFIRSGDDSIALKGWDIALPALRTSESDNNNITVARTTLWVDHAHGWNIGAENGLNAIRNVLFKDIDLLHYSNTGWNAITVAPADEAQLYNVIFDNIRINHEGQPQFLEVVPQYDYSSISVRYWATGGVAGQIKNPAGGCALAFKNISLTGNSTANQYAKVLLSGKNSTHLVDGVSFDNVTRHGQLTGRTSAGVSIGGYTSHLKFNSDAVLAPCVANTSPIPAPYTSSAPPDTVVPSIPANLNGTAASSSQVNLTWSASSDNVGVTGYKVYSNGQPVATVTGTSHNVTGLAALTSYNFTVASFDAAGNNSALSAIKVVTTLVGGGTSCPARANANIYVAANDFSGTQGCNQWSYRDSIGANLIYNSTTAQWKGSETYLLIMNNIVHPGNNADVIRRWTANATGSISITGNAVDVGGIGSGADGVNVSIKKGTGVLWQSNLVNGSTTSVAYNVTTTVAAGDTIDFVVNKLTNNSNDSTSFNPTITFTPSGTVSLVPPTILSPANGAVVTNTLNTVTISWGAVSGATGYAVRMIDNQDSSIRDSRNSSGCAYLCIDTYAGTSITMNVRTGHTYSFWIHSRAGTGSYPGPSWSSSNARDFSYTFR